MLQVENLSRTYETPGGALSILESVSMDLNAGEAATIMGPSGSGKSSLLYILGALEPPTAGSVRLNGRDPFSLSEEEQARWRSEEVGFVFQDHCLLPQCSVLENVLVPSLAAASDEGLEARARELLDGVGLTGRLAHKPAELSGGEKQRVAIARALIRKPGLVLCDEPTGNLDRASAGAVGSLLLDLHREQQSILIAVTHSQEFGERFPIRFELRNRSLERV